jgi:hypothetical protein
MAKKPRNSDPSNSSRNKSGRPRVDYRSVKWRGYVNPKVPEQYRALFGEYSEDVARWSSHFRDISASGYKMAWYYDDNADCAVATAYGYHPDCPYAGYTMSVRSSDVWTSVLRLLFIHYVVLDQCWDEWLPDRDEIEEW